MSNYLFQSVTFQALSPYNSPKPKPISACPSRTQQNQLSCQNPTNRPTKFPQFQCNPITTQDNRRKYRGVSFEVQGNSVNYEHRMFVVTQCIVCFGSDATFSGWNRITQSILEFPRRHPEVCSIVRWSFETDDLSNLKLPMPTQ